MTAWLEASGVEGVLIGGVASSILGRPRTTRDIDALVWLEEARWEEFLEAGAGHGFRPRASEVLPFARRSRVLLLRHQPSSLDVDLVLGALPFEKQVLAERRTVQIGEARFAVPSPENLIILKAVARRPRDLADIEGVLDAHPHVDLNAVRRWVGEFAKALEAPEILEDIENLLRRRKQT